jgi:hypothetical protein
VQRFREESCSYHLVWSWSEEVEAFPGASNAAHEKQARGVDVLTFLFRQPDGPRRPIRLGPMFALAQLLVAATGFALLIWTERTESTTS